MTSKLYKLEDAIIKKYCPFKKGDKVIFREWWRKNNKDYYGIIYSIRFNGIQEEAINNRWVITVRPTTKDFSEIKNKFNMSYKLLGENKQDFITKLS